MTDLLTQLAETGFKQILIISPVVNYRRSLAMSLVKLLPKPSFSALDPEEQGLPDEHYDWSAIDLVMIDLSESKQSIKHWYIEQLNQVNLPPAIFLDNKATIDDAGDLIRGGGADYIELTTMNTRRLARALLIAADERYSPAGKQEDPDVTAERAALVEEMESEQLSSAETFPNIHGMNDEPTEALPVLTSVMLSALEEAKPEAENPSFLTTGLMDILDRQKLKEQYETNSQAEETKASNDFLTTGLISILERGKPGEPELSRSPEIQTEPIPVGNNWPFSQQQIDEGTAELGDYRIIQFIEVGGTASVFKAEDKTSGEVFAIKLLDEDQGVSNNRERFLRGYRLIQSVQHPHIVCIRELVSNADHTYVVMEYFPGGDLKQRIAGGIERAQSVRYTAEIASALNAAHQQDILHRDLKPSNVLMREDGTLALLDFGIAKLMAESKSDLTQVGFVVGTSQYISPEQALGKPLDARSDLYALGVMFFEMLEGRRPYTGKTTIEIMQQHVRAPVPQLSSTHDPLNPIIQQLMAKDPDQRFNTGLEVVDALRQAIPELVDNHFLQNL